MEIKALIFETFNIEITQAAISLSRHYRAAKKELTAQIAEGARAELEASMPLVVKDLTRHMGKVAKEREKCELALSLKKEGSMEYTSISKTIAGLDKSFCDYLDRFNSLLDNTTGMSASPSSEEELKQDVKEFIDNIVPRDMNQN